MTLPVQVLFEDDDVLAVDKPVGIAVVPGRGETPADALRGVLEAARGRPLWVVHRLDRDTSGVLLFAKHAAAHRALSMAFEARFVQKRYVALAYGAPPEDRGVCRLPLGPGRKGRMRVYEPLQPGALAAETAWEVLVRVSGACSRIAFAPTTGRQHQLRVHAAAIGMPILGDPLYAFGPARAAAPRLMLHATAIMLPAVDGMQMKNFASALPSDFAEIEALFIAR